LPYKNPREATVTKIGRPWSFKFLFSVANNDFEVGQLVDELGVCACACTGVANDRADGGFVPSLVSFFF
jgi:hypothetical protein